MALHYSFLMTKMSKTQRTAILAAHAAQGEQRGRIDAYQRTHEALRRSGWEANGIHVTRAGLIAAGVDMDALHDDALMADEAFDRTAVKYAVAMVGVGKTQRERVAHGAAELVASEEREAFIRDLRANPVTPEPPQGVAALAAAVRLGVGIEQLAMLDRAARQGLG